MDFVYWWRFSGEGFASAACAAGLFLTLTGKSSDTKAGPMGGDAVAEQHEVLGVEGVLNLKNIVIFFVKIQEG